MADLDASGLLIECDTDSHGMTINGHRIEEREPDSGERGIWSLDLARLMWQLLMKRPPILDFVGRGRQDRQIVSSLLHFVVGQELPEEFSNVGPA